jgi:hypothetical protein
MSAHGHMQPVPRGSFGLLVEDLEPEPGETDKRLILTAAHLFNEMDGTPMKDGVGVLWTPPGPLPDVAVGQACGVLHRRVPMCYLPDIGVDAAVVKPRPNIECANNVGGACPTDARDLWIQNGRDEVVGVRKFGAETHETRGELLAIEAHHQVLVGQDREAHYSSGWWACSQDGTGFADRGDSGSIVVDDAQQVVGMLVAIQHPDSNDAEGYVHGISQIFKALRIRLPES